MSLSSLISSWTLRRRRSCKISCCCSSASTPRSSRWWSFNLSKARPGTETLVCAYLFTDWTCVASVNEVWQKSYLAKQFTAYRCVDLLIWVVPDIACLMMAIWSVFMWAGCCSCTHSSTSSTDHSDTRLDKSIAPETTSAAPWEGKETHSKENNLKGCVAPNVFQVAPVLTHQFSIEL